MSKKRKQYSPEFKAKVALAAIKRQIGQIGDRFIMLDMDSMGIKILGTGI